MTKCPVTQWVDCEADRLYPIGILVSSWRDLPPNRGVDLLSDPTPCLQQKSWERSSRHRTTAAQLDLSPPNSVIVKCCQPGRHAVLLGMQEFREVAR